MIEEVKYLMDIYINAENKFIIALDGLENAGLECDCNHEEVIKIIHEGGFDEIVTRCLICGGDVI